jgi:hypothetical protein
MFYVSDEELAATLVLSWNSETNNRVENSVPEASKRLVAWTAYQSRGLSKLSRSAYRGNDGQSVPPPNHKTTGLFGVIP